MSKEGSGDRQHIVDEVVDEVVDVAIPSYSNIRDIEHKESTVGGF